MNTLSWRTPTTPMPMEINPRKVFERMFGSGGSAKDRLARINEDRSILDAISKEAASLELQVGAQDRNTLTQYLENVPRDRAPHQLAEKSQNDESLVLPDRPAGVPFDYEEHIKLMYDLLALSYQANITRVSTFMVAREVSNRTYPQVGVTDGPPRHLAPPEPGGEDGEERPDPDLQHRSVQVLPRSAGQHAGWRRLAARSHRVSSTAAT
jgi:hypothetical protein